MFADIASLHNNTFGQVFIMANELSQVYPMKTKGDAADQLNHFIQMHGIMETLVMDGAKEEYYGQWSDTRKKYLIHQRRTELHSSWQNKMESKIHELKNHY